MRWAAILVACAACWGEPPAPVAPREPPPPVRARQTYAESRHTIARVPLTELDELLSKIDELTNDMCRCSDQACVQQVTSGMYTWISEWQQQHADYKPSEDEQRQLQEAATPMMACMTNANANQPATMP